MNVPTVAAVDVATLCSRIECRKPDHGDVRIEGNRLMRGDKALTPVYKAIDSFDVSSMRKEVVFSAKRENNFDIGLVSIDGSDVHWVPSDPSDETDVQWGGRPNTISYVIHTASGDAVRVVHVGSSIQFLSEEPYSSVRSVVWSGDRMNVIVSSVVASTRVESMKFNTEDLRVETPSAARLDVLTEPVAGGVLMRPPSIRYGEKLPLVVWIAPAFEWNDARASLMRNARLACAVVRSDPDEAFWTAVAAMPWIDSTRIYVVGGRGARKGVTYFAADRAIGANLYRQAGSTVFAAPAVVQSVAAGFIADQLKGTAAGNGSHG